MIKVEFNNQTKYSCPRKNIETIFNVACKKNKLVSIGFVTPQTIKKMNKIYRKKDQITDVLSFSEKGVWAEKNFLGEIIICPKQAEKQAPAYGNSTAKEIVRLALHGFLHLLGYDHEKVSEAEKMEALERKILKKMYA